MAMPVPIPFKLAFVTAAGGGVGIGAGPAAEAPESAVAFAVLAGAVVSMEAIEWLAASGPTVVVGRAGVAGTTSVGRAGGLMAGLIGVVCAPGEYTAGAAVCGIKLLLPAAITSAAGCSGAGKS
jgi:hypothetical protein